MIPALFTPFRLRSLTLSNRIVVAPMCQYSAVDGMATDWHLLHLGSLAVSGAGLVMLEATGVEPRGRITDECLGLYSDACEEALSKAVGLVRRYSSSALGIQLSHAGRKASTSRLAEGLRAQLPPEKGWQTLAPSPLPFAEDRSEPRAMTRPDMDEVLEAFRDATRRAARLGFDLVEIHAAHGYLLSSFLSPLANLREDAYGGSLENRMRFPIEVFEAVRAEWPSEKPLGVRLNGTDWLEGGISIEEAVRFSMELRGRGCDFVDVSSGGNGQARIRLESGYQVPLASRIRTEANLPVIAVGLIRDPHHAERIVADGQADLVALGRGMLNDPRWPWHAAEALGHNMEVPYQYCRAATSTGLPAADTRQRSDHGSRSRQG